jgi:glycosyltransferase involved in cell wall biosynthesis
MDKPLLSICIPTYSRAHFLKECLDSITSQFSDPEIIFQVEIVVSDNASTDSTAELVKNYQAKYTNIHYSRNATNLGFDRNVSAVLSLGRGKFRWLMSDDEMIKPNSLKFILPILLTHPEVGYFCIDQDKLSPTEDFKIYQNGSAWLKELGLTGGLISQNIYNGDFLFPDISKYYDNLWIHFSVALEILAKHKGMLIKNLFLEPAVPRKTTWAGGGQAFNTFNNLHKIIRKLPESGYDSQTVKRILMGMATDLPKNIASAKIHGLKISFLGLKILFQEYRNYPQWFCFGLLVYFTPSMVWKFLKGNLREKLWTL